MKRSIYFTLFLSALLFASCNSQDIPGDRQDNKNIEICFSVPNYNKVGATTRATTDTGSSTEQSVANLYLFLFDNTGANPAKYYIDAASFSGGAWSEADKKVTLNMTQAEAGERQVYIIANCADLRTQLDGVNTTDELKTVFKTTTQPWSPNIDTPILMSGNKTHNFIDNRVLGSGGPNAPVHLIRAVAKLELNIKLTSEFQVVQTDKYKYRYVDFDTRTYVEKPAPRPDNSANSSPDAWPNTVSWTPWGASLNGATPSDTGTGYTLSGDGKVTGLKLITYLNERDQSGTTVEIELPRADSGPLPPPEFGPELYKLPLPTIIERNTWYKYDIEI